ncbi:hypothetical protein Sru01_53210 [Sphaerisporangium rufum]|uniref:Uncharacterized protein n=1 Tax=Sphaerisporangium rufum TaxID=1381558 RepID=A0A919V229_9ACTN|nr:hypothetical protein [Sphaerisporangium rufum]GII80339.1 hypothetical protein Sru01_53210 [Sphaerisporangium rufum]
MLVELTMCPTVEPGASAGSPVDGIRILALLPDQWRKDLRQANGEIVIRVETADGTTPAQIEATVTEALTDPAISHWRLRACQTLAAGPDDPR